MTTRRAVAFFLAALFLTALSCATSEKRRLEDIKIGMSKQEVLKLWGEPRKQDVRTPDPNTYDEEWVYVFAGGKKVTVLIHNGIVKNREYKD
jgi:outer membrane protein assembly factor BamE (lipoprotein component of BamABCDE complex)